MGELNIRFRNNKNSSCFVHRNFKSALATSKVIKSIGNVKHKQFPRQSNGI